MDEANGPIFDHHDELFSQIGHVDPEQQLKDFVLEMTGSSVAGSSGVQGNVWGSCPQRLSEPLQFPIGSNCNELPLVPQQMSQRNYFPASDISYGNNATDAASSAFLDNLVKTIPDEMLDGYNNLEAIKRSLMNLPDKQIEPPAPIPASLLNTMHRISMDNGTQEYLDALSKPDNLGPGQIKPPDQPIWNGGVDNFPLQSTLGPKIPPNPGSIVQSIDRNGNCPTGYNNGLPERMKPVGNPDVTKSRMGFIGMDAFSHDTMLHSQKNTHQLETTDMYNHKAPSLPEFLSRELAQNMMVKVLSPSVSVDTGIHTPTTSCDSASPLSSGRTPLRSDDSISPLASCASPATSVRTPMRTDDCFSPGRVRRADTSPIVRTPIRCEETPSPRGISRTPMRIEDVPSPAMRPSMRCDDIPSPAMRSSARVDDVASPSMRMAASPAAPSPRSVPRTPHRPDDAPSPRGISRTPLRSDDALSPRGMNRTPMRVEEVPSPRAVNWPHSRPDEALSPRAPNRTPLRCEEAPSPRQPGRTPLRNDEALSPRTMNRTPLRVEDTSSPRAVARTPLRHDEAPSPRSVAPNTIRTDETVSPRVISRTPTRQDVSPLPPRAPFSPGTVRRKEAPTDLQAGPTVPTTIEEINSPGKLSSAAGSEKAFHSDGVVLPANTSSKIKKRRKTDATGAPAPKKRWSKKMPIYQSSVSGEESGIKLKLKLTAMPPPKRRRRRTGGTEEVEDKAGGKRRKKGPPTPGDQSPWGQDMPPHVLEKIFRHLVDEEGCVPSLVRLSWVCRLWNSVANKTDLWQNVDLSSPCIKQKCKIDRYFRWLLENRMGRLRDLNLNGWKFSNLPMVLSLIGTHCSEVESIGLSGWQGLHFEHLRSLLQDCPRITRIDLSDVSPESKSTNSAVSPKAITHLTETMADRLTELTLAHNTLSCLPQIISSLASNCPNLQVLDLSNIRRASHAEFALHVEELQTGCPLLRVLRITNSGVTIASVPFDQQAASPGFVELEELSIAGHQGTESLRITSVMDDDCLERIVKTSQKLRLLDVRGCTKITESSLVRVPAWDIQHLYLSGCLVTRQSGSGLELIAQKWSHSLIEVDLAWASVAEDVNAAVLALAERGAESPLRVLNLCGSAVEPAPIKTILTRCPGLQSLNLQSCRGLPRGVKKLYEGDQLPELLEQLQSNDEQDDG